MKKHHILFGLLALTLSLGVTGFALNSNKNVVKAEASSSDTRLFVKIENINDLHVDDVVIMATPAGAVFTSLAGNPVFATGEYLGGRNDEGSKFYFTQKNRAMLLQVCQGIRNGEFAFKSIKDESDYPYAHYTNGRYLAYGHDYSDSTYHGIQAYGDINMQDTVNEFTSWKITITDDYYHFAFMKRSNEQYNTHIQWKSDQTRPNFGYYTGYQNICLYKQVSLDQDHYTINTVNEQEQTVVYEGDRLDLTGLKLKLTIDKDTVNEFVYYSEYNDDHAYYSVNPALLSSGFIGISFAGLNYNILGVTVIEDTSNCIYFEEVNYIKGDYRGTYLIAATDGDDVYQFRGSNLETLYYTNTGNHSVIVDNLDSKILINRFMIKKMALNGVMYEFLINGADEYLINNSGNLALTNNFENVTVDSAVTIDDNLFINLGNYKLYADGYFYLGENPSLESRAKLFKRLVDYSYRGKGTVKLTTFLDTFDEYTSENCYASGDTAPTITSEYWNITLANAFEDIGEYDLYGYDLQGYLANLTYNTNSETAGSDKDLINRYDFILSKHSEKLLLNDFIGRQEAGTLQNHISQTIYTFNIINEDNFSTVIIILSVVIITSVSVIILLKKRSQKAN